MVAIGTVAVRAVTEEALRHLKWHICTRLLKIWMFVNLHVTCLWYISIYHISKSHQNTWKTLDLSTFIICVNCLKYWFQILFSFTSSCFSYYNTWSLCCRALYVSVRYILHNKVRHTFTDFWNNMCCCFIGKCVQIYIL